MTQDYWSKNNRWWDWELARRIGTHQTNHEATYYTRSHHSKLDPKKGKELEPQALQLPTLLQQISAGCILTCCPSVYLSVCRREATAELTSTNFKELATKGFTEPSFLSTTIFSYLRMRSEQLQQLISFFIGSHLKAQSTLPCNYCWFNLHMTATKRSTDQHN